MYHNLSSNEIFSTVNKLKELSSDLVRLLIRDSIDNPQDIKDYFISNSKMLVSLVHKKTLMTGDKIVDKYVEGLLSLTDKQNDNSYYVESFIKKNNIKVKDIKATLTKMLEDYNSSRIERAKRIMQQNPKSKMINETRIRVARQSAELKSSTGWQNVKALPSLVVGQDEATKKIVNKIIGSFVGFKSEKEPVATFLLTGPTGVGKTESAKAVAKLCCEGNIFVVDMTTFKHESDISRLLGASPGYVGYGDRNTFCDFLNEHPNGVILFDEIEKAARGCLDLLMRILDEGEFIDSRGRTISLRESVIFCTTNLTEYIEDSEDKNISVEEKMTTHECLRKEIVGRFSEVVEFKRLSHECCREIVKRFIDEKIESFDNKNKNARITLSYTPGLVDRIIRDANTDKFGARDLNKTIQKYFITPVSDYMIEYNLSNVNLIVDCDTIKESDKVRYGLIDDNKNVTI